MTARNQFQGITHEGMLRAEGRRFAIVAARFNDFIVDKLVEGALDALRRTGGDDERIEIFRCPGAMELPGLARRVVDLGRFDAVICLGAVIRGATPHFDLVVGEAARGIAELAVGGRCGGGVRRARLRHHRAGGRARRHQGRQPRLRRGDGGARDGRLVRRAREQQAGPARHRAPARASRPHRQVTR